MLPLDGEVWKELNSLLDGRRGGGSGGGWGRTETGATKGSKEVDDKVGNEGGVGEGGICTSTLPVGGWH